MKKLLLLPVCLVLFFGQVKLDASEHVYFLNSIANMSFNVNNSPVSIDTTMLNSMVEVLKAGNELTFTANITSSPMIAPGPWSAAPSQTSPMYALWVSSSAWGTSQYPVVANISSISSCSLNVSDVNPKIMPINIVLPINNGAAISLKIVIVPFLNPANFAVQLGENLKNIQGFYVIDSKDYKYDATVAIQNLKKQYGNISEATLSYYRTGHVQGDLVKWGFNVDLVFENNRKASVPIFQTNTFVTDHMGMPLSVYINDIRVVVLTTHMGWPYCRFIA